MNAEFTERGDFGGLLGEAATNTSFQKPTRAKRAVCIILSVCSILSYATAVYYVAEKTASGEWMRHAISSVLLLYEDEPTEELRVTVSVESSEETEKEQMPSLPSVSEKEEGISILREDLSCEDFLLLANETDYSPDTEKLAALSAGTVLSKDSPGPLVLVIHTHGTEAYSPSGADVYTNESTFRSEDQTENVVAVGRRICDTLESMGIRSIHCTEMFDRDSYVDSYKRSAEAVRVYLERYPSLKYVLDVHRDAIFRSDMSLIAPVTKDEAAQVMLVCGTDEMGADFPHWEKNLSFALALQWAAKEEYPDLMRSINLRGASFNQQLAGRYLLVEVGSAGNTVEEAILAGERFARVFGEVTKG